MKVLSGQKRLATQIGRNDFAQGGRQSRDVADRAGTRSLGGAEGFAHEISEVSFLGPVGFSDLDKHGLRGSACYIIVSNIIYNTIVILLATKTGQNPIFIGVFKKAGGS